MGLIEMMLKTYNGDHWSREKISTTQKKRLDAFLKYARERVRFIKNCMRTWETIIPRQIFRRSASRN